VILSSTDKAAYPINAYGNTKALAEKLVLQNKRNVVCRYGNVIASRGSAIPLFVKSLREHQTVSITHACMTRFFIRIEDAAQFVYEQSKAWDGGLKIPEMKGTTMLEVVRAIAELLEIPEFKTDFTGIRPGEKIHECLRMAHEGDETDSLRCAHFSFNELKTLLEPFVRVA
jgi:FlaA1/EpsC-like NDP-sugar epimerase